MRTPVRPVDVERARGRGEAFKLAGGGVVVLLASELVSALIRATTPLEARFWIVRPVVSLHYQEHPGGLGGLGGLIVVAGVAVAPAAYWYLTGLPGFRNPGMIVRIGTALCLGGGAANNAERLVRGSVSDYLSIRLNGGGTVFDAADVAVYLGLLLFSTALVRHLTRQKARVSNVGQRRS